MFASALRGATWSSAATVVNTVVGLASLFVLVRLLGPVNYGLFAMATVALSIPLAISGDILSQSLIQQKRLSPAAQTTIFLLELCIAATLWLIVVLFAPLVARWFEEPLVADLVFALAPILVMRAVASVAIAQVRRKLEFKALAIVNTGSTVLSVALGVTLALLDFGVWSLIYMQLMQYGSRLVLALLLSRWWPGTAPTLDSVRPLFHFNMHTLAIRLLRSVSSSLPPALIGGVLGASDLGIFEVARRFFKRINGLLIGPLNNVTLPVASKLQRETEDLRRWHGFLSVTVTALAYPLFIGIASILPVAVPVLFSEKWIAAIVPMQIMMLVGIRNATGFFNGGILRGRGKPELATRMSLVSLLLSCLLLPAAVSFGVPAVVWAMVVCSVGSWMVGTYYVDKELDSGFGRQFIVGWQSLVAAIFMFIVVTYTHNNFLLTSPRWISFFVLVTVGAISHFAVLRFLDKRTVEQLTALVRALVSKDRSRLTGLVENYSAAH